MTEGRSSGLTWTWLALVALTVASTALADAGHAPLVAGSVALAAGALKAWWILLDFLELRHAPSGWRTAFALWIWLVAGAAWGGLMVSLLRA